MFAMKLTLQVLVPLLLGVDGTNVHGFGVTLAVEPAGLIVKPTVPTGALLSPVAVSVTVTVQLAGLFGGVEGAHSIFVVVVRRPTTTVSVPLLPAWIVPGAGLYAAVMV